MTIIKHFFGVLFVFIFLIGCGNDQKIKSKDEIISKKTTVLYKNVCGSCHLTPSIEDLPKDIWENNILPLMSARMGLLNDPKLLKRPIINQIKAINRAGLQPSIPMLSYTEWKKLKDYIISIAPDSLTLNNNNRLKVEMKQFKPIPISLDTLSGSYITFLKYDTKRERLIIGNISGNLNEYNYGENELENINKFQSAITDHTLKDGIEYTTRVGILNPSEKPFGKISIKDGDQKKIISNLHRPVNSLVYDLNGNYKKEIIISEFGNLRGKLTIYSEDENHQYKPLILSNQPGAIRTIVKDMNNDGKEDLITMFAQGDENITIFYNQGDLKFKAEKVIRFSPVYGSSWFELIDFNKDGYQDIITVNGDNADYSYVQKPYHGLRIYINNGKNQFDEKYFYPMNGATRFVTNDFDEDGDFDFGIISNFPDYENEPYCSFVYLENKSSDSFDFIPFTMKESTLGRWFLMDTGDVDLDGDIDIILSSFTYSFSPVPKKIEKEWNSNGVDILVLKNTLKN